MYYVSFDQDCVSRSLIEYSKSREIELNRVFEEKFTRFEIIRVRKQHRSIFNISLLSLQISPLWNNNHPFNNLIIQIKEEEEEEEEEEEATADDSVSNYLSPAEEESLRKLNRPLFFGRYNSPVLNANLSTPRGYGVYGTALAWLWPRPRANLYRNHQNVTTSGKRCWRPAEREGTSLKFTLNIHRDRARWQEADGTEIGAFLIELMRYWKLVEVFSSLPIFFYSFVRLPWRRFHVARLKNSHFHIFVEHLWSDIERSSVKDIHFQKCKKIIIKYLWNVQNGEFDDWIKISIASWKENYSFANLYPYTTCGMNFAVCN